jgi:hypothetical protein
MRRIEMLRRRLFFCYVLLGCLLLGSSGQAATFTINIEGLDDVNGSGIAGFTFFLDVGSDFVNNNSVFGDAVPTTGMWLADSYADSTKFGAADWGPLLVNAELASLQNGTILTIDYDGTIFGFDEVQFVDLTGFNLYPDEISLASITDNGVTFSAVPIPGAVWLLGAGFSGLIALRRKYS